MTTDLSCRHPDGTIKPDFWFDGTIRVPAPQGPERGQIHKQTENSKGPRPFDGRGPIRSICDAAYLFMQHLHQGI